MPEKEEEKQEKEQEEKQEEQQEQQEKWDKEKQRADQAEANYQKLAADKGVVEDELAEQQTKVTELETKLAGQAEQKEIELAKMDGDLVDQNVISNFEKTLGELKDAKKRLATVETEIKGYKEAETQKQLKADQDKRREKILKQTDDEFGAKYRNKAIKMANDLVQEGKEKEPADSFDAYVLIAKCYKKLADEDTKEEKEEVPVDTGIGGFTFGKEGLKEGTLEEVQAQMKKEGKFKDIKFTVP